MICRPANTILTPSSTGTVQHITSSTDDYYNVPGSIGIVNQLVFGVTQHFRGYALFDIPTGLGTADSVVLHFATSQLFSPGTTLRVSQVTPFGASPDLAALFTDLGDGDVYASVVLNGLFGDTPAYSLTLSSTALSNLNAAHGDVFALGFADDTLRGVLVNHVTLEVSTAVPEPASAWLVLIGLATLTLRHRFAARQSI